MVAVDPCLRHKNGVFITYHVDDFLIVGPESNVRVLIGQIQKQLTCKWKEVTTTPVKFLGRELYREQDHFIFSLPVSYASDALRDFGLDHLSPLSRLTYLYEEPQETGKDFVSGDPPLSFENQNEVCMSEVFLSEDYDDEDDFLPTCSPELRKVSFKKTKRPPPDSAKGELDIEMQRNYRQLLGRLLWLEHPAVRPICIILAGKAGKCTFLDWKNIVSVFRFLIHSPMLQKIIHTTFDIPSIENIPIGSLYCQSDASWGLPGHMERKSLSGGVIFLKCNKNRWYPVSTLCKKQSTIALSSFESEISAIVANCVNCLGALNILETIFPGENRIINLATDSSSALLFSARKGAGKRSKHLDTRIYYLQEIHSRKYIRFSKVGGNMNISDLYTKVHSHPVVWMLNKLGFY